MKDKQQSHGTLVLGESILPKKLHQCLVPQTQLFQTIFHNINGIGWLIYIILSSHNHGSVENGCISKYEFPPSFRLIINDFHFHDSGSKRISNDLFPFRIGQQPSKQANQPPSGTVSMRELPSTQNSKRLTRRSNRKIFDVKTLVTVNKVMENTTPYIPRN